MGGWIGEEERERMRVRARARERDGKKSYTLECATRFSPIWGGYD